MAKIISSGKALHSPEFYIKKQKRSRLVKYVSLGGVVLVVCATVLLLRSNKFLIQGVRVEGINALRAEEVEKQVMSELRGNYFWLIPRASTFFYPRSIQDKLLIDFPRMEAASVNVGEGRMLDVLVKERAPHALYCKTMPSDITATDCYFLDNRGLIFSTAPAFSGDVYFIYTKSEVIDAPIGKQFLEREMFEPLRGFIQNLEPLGVLPRSLLVGGAKYHINLRTSGELILDTDNDLPLALANLNTFINSDVVTGDQDFMDKLLYIDLRTANKIFYKFKE